MYRNHEFLGENTVLIITPNYHKTLIRTVTLIALLSQFASILVNEADTLLGVTLDEVLEIHRDTYLGFVIEDVRTSSEDDSKIAD